MAVKKEHRGFQVSMPDGDKEELRRLAKKRGFESLSDYVRELIRKEHPHLKMKLDDPRR